VGLSNDERYRRRCLTLGRSSAVELLDRTISRIETSRGKLNACRGARLPSALALPPQTLPTSCARERRPLLACRSRSRRFQRRRPSYAPVESPAPSRCAPGMTGGRPCPRLKKAGACLSSARPTFRSC